jgi:ssDNA-binding Zn-finger/Zn-ribbon topoisomerase 1
MGYALQQEVQLETRECGACGILFAAPKSFWAERRRTGAGWYCPNGHSRIFTETDVQKLQKQLDAEKQRVEFLKREIESQRGQLTAAKGQVTKARNKLKRVSHGVCPECHRTFVNVARHMQSKHGAVCNQPPEGAVLRSERELERGG